MVRITMCLKPGMLKAWADDDKAVEAKLAAKDKPLFRSNGLSTR